MKYSALIGVLTCIVLACSQPIRGKNGKLYKNAVEYNDYIVNRQTIIMKNVMDFVKISGTDIDSAGKMLDRYILEMDSLISDVRAMPSYKGDSILRDAAIGSFGFYKKVFGNEYKQLLGIRRSGESGTKDGVAEMNKIVEQITLGEEQYDKIFHNAQDDFAKKNNMTLEENELQKKIDKIDQ